MSVYLELPGKGKIDEHKDDDKTVFAYQVSEGGVLRVLVSDTEDGTWSVTREYSPAAWSEVSGKRYNQDVQLLGGFLGGSVEKESAYATRGLEVI